MAGRRGRGTRPAAPRHREALLEIDGQRLPFLFRQDLIANKRAAGRPRDLADLADLEG